MRLHPCLLLASGFATMIATAESQLPPVPGETPRTALVIHAGAGVIERRALSEADEAAVRRDLDRALDAGNAVLKRVRPIGASSDCQRQARNAWVIIVTTTAPASSHGLARRVSAQTSAKFASRKKNARSAMVTATISTVRTWDRIVYVVEVRIRIL